MSGIAMPHRALLALAAILPLAACGGGGATAQNDAAAQEAPGNAIARIQTLNEGERNATLFRAIRDANRDCQGVVRSVATDPIQGKPAWIATCDNGGEWLVAIGADGTALVTNGRP
ncbi:hypothetical protein [Sphingomonas adhaesiva]|uniref:hypothetical protein n=1 Tax=Sphingomonas adhaesiva TaxID=28212 RepID=UPI002FF8A8B4